MLFPKVILIFVRVMISYLLRANTVQTREGGQLNVSMDGQLSNLILVLARLGPAFGRLELWVHLVHISLRDFQVICQKHHLSKNACICLYMHVHV